MERYVRSISEDLTNHVTPMSADHLQRRVREYVKYFNQNRNHSFLVSDEVREAPNAMLISEITRAKNLFVNLSSRKYRRGEFR